MRTYRNPTEPVSPMHSPSSARGEPGIVQTVAGEVLLPSPYRYLGVLHSAGSSDLILARAHGEQAASVDTVVFKILKRSVVELPRIRERFHREYETMERLSDLLSQRPLHRGNLEDGRPFLAYRHLPGDTLTAHPGPHREAQVRAWLMDVLRVLQGVHGRGFVHRDLKPDNLLLDHHQRLHPIDWGSAVALAGAAPGGQTQDENESHDPTQSKGTWVGVPPRSLTPLGHAMGTPAYAAPEQFATNAESLPQPCMDLYSLALVVMELITGERVRAGNTAQELTRHIDHEFHVALNLPGASASIRNALALALQVDPALRIRTAREMIDQLHRP